MEWKSEQRRKKRRRGRRKWERHSFPNLNLLLALDEFQGPENEASACVIGKTKIPRPRGDQDHRV